MTRAQANRGIAGAREALRAVIPIPTYREGRGSLARPRTGQQSAHRGALGRSGPPSDSRSPRAHRPALAVRAAPASAGLTLRSAGTVRSWRRRRSVTDGGGAGSDYLVLRSPIEVNPPGCFAAGGDGANVLVADPEAGLVGRLETSDMVLAPRHPSTAAIFRRNRLHIAVEVPDEMCWGRTRRFLNA